MDNPKEITKRVRKVAQVVRLGMKIVKVVRNGPEDREECIELVDLGDGVYGIPPDKGTR